MYEEAREFSLQMKLMEKDLLILERTMESNFTNLRNIMLASLPRVFTTDAEGNTHPSPDHENSHQLIGHHVNIDKLNDSLRSMKERIQSDVLMPMGEWSKEFKRVGGEMKTLEARRLEVDSRRRTVADLNRQLEAHKMKALRKQSDLVQTAAAPSEKDFKVQQLIEWTSARKVHKEEKLNNDFRRYQDHEAEVFESLFKLISDAAYLKDYCSCALSLVNECFAGALSAFDGGVDESLNAMPTSRPDPRPVAPVAQPLASPAKAGMFQALGKMFGGSSARGGADVNRYDQQFDGVQGDQNTGKIAPPSIHPTAAPQQYAPQYIQPMYQAQYQGQQWARSPEAF
jgi:hypothetical protein